MSGTTTPEAPQVTLQEALDKTDFGHWMYSHRKSFIAAVVLVFVGASGWMLFQQYSRKQAQERSAQVYEFESQVAAPLREGKGGVAEFTSKFQALPSDVKASPSMLPVALQTAAYLVEKGEPVLAQSVLKNVTDAVGAKSPLYIMVAHSYAALAEKNGQADEAIKTLEAYVSQGHKVMLAKAYLDLGRLYLGKQDTAKARANFEHIVANHPNDEWAKMAKLYLQQLPAK